MKLTLHDGTGERVIVSSIADQYEPEQLIGRKIVVLVNLKPHKFGNEYSNGMLLAASASDGTCRVLFADDCEIARRSTEKYSKNVAPSAEIPRRAHCKGASLSAVRQQYEREQRKNRCSLSLLVCRKARNTASEAYIRLCGVQTLTTLVEQARVELASYRIAERQFLHAYAAIGLGAPSLRPKKAPGRSLKTAAASAPLRGRLYPRLFDARIPRREKGSGRNRLIRN